MVIEKIISSIKHSKKYFYALCFSLVPLLSASALCLMGRNSITNIFLPNCIWTDELMYFKQVESIVNVGTPLGYFGYNEIPAKFLSFGAWSPIIYIPYALFGYIFGWNINSPVFYNILFVMIAFFVFYVSCVPRKKEIILLSILYVLFAPITRYIISGLSEAIFVSLSIVYISLLISFFRKIKNGIFDRKTLFLIILIVFLMSSMRGYYSVLLIPIIVYYFKNRSYTNAVLYISILIVVSLLYLLIMKYFAAPYYEEQINLDIVRIFFYDFKMGLKGIFNTFVTHGKTFFVLVTHPYDNCAAGGIYLIFMLELIFLLIDFKLNRNYLSLSLFLEIVTIFLAIVTLYNDLYCGSRHMIAIELVALFYILVSNSTFFSNKLICIGTVLFMFFVFDIVPKADSYLYHIGYMGKSDVEKYNNIRDVLQERMPIVSKLSWDNTTILVRSSENNARWQLLYSLPKGMAINFCKSDYVKENFDLLKSKYIVVNTNDDIYSMCINKGFSLLLEDNGTAFFMIR